MVPEDLYKREYYTNRGIAYLINDSIYEYDIHAANINIIQYFNLLPKDQIESIKHMEKSRRNKKIGVIMRDDQSMKEKISEGFSKVRKMFYDENNLEFNDIIAVKKDAIFTRRICEKTMFDNIEFRVKNQYSSFMQLKGIELYYNGSIDVKGIDDEKLKLHENGILWFLNEFFRRAETQDNIQVIRYLRKYATDYKLRMLPIDHYRSFNSGSHYEILGSKETYDEYWDEKKGNLDISNNWNCVIIPIILMLY